VVAKTYRTTYCEEKRSTCLILTAEYANFKD
jgi:hypothetical protein